MVGLGSQLRQSFLWSQVINNLPCHPHTPWRKGLICFVSHCAPTLNMVHGRYSENVFIKYKNESAPMSNVVNVGISNLTNYWVACWAYKCDVILCIILGVFCWWWWFIFCVASELALEVGKLLMKFTWKLTLITHRSVLQGFCTNYKLNRCWINLKGRDKQLLKYF